MVKKKLKLTSNFTSKSCYSKANTVDSSSNNKAEKSKESFAENLVPSSTYTTSTRTKDTMSTTNTTATATVSNAIKIMTMLP